MLPTSVQNFLLNITGWWKITLHLGQVSQVTIKPETETNNKKNSEETGQIQAQRKTQRHLQLIRKYNIYEKWGQGTIKIDN